MRRVLIAALGSAAALAATPASASLVYDPVITSVSGQGFGNVPRDLTFQATGQASEPDSGCIGVASGGTITFGTCIGNGSVHDSNGVANTGGDESNPLADNQKHGIPTVASLGITSASDIGILFNATDPGGDGVNLIDLTLKFYNTAGQLLGAIDGSYNFSGTEVGNGGAGFIFVVSGDEQAYINGILGIGGTIYMALEASTTGADGGPESFAIVNLRNPPPVPEPATWAMMLLGFGGIGMAMRRKQRRNGALMQVA